MLPKNKAVRFLSFVKFAIIPPGKNHCLHMFFFFEFLYPAGVYFTNFATDKSFPSPIDSATASHFVRSRKAIGLNFQSDRLS